MIAASLATLLKLVGKRTLVKETCLSDGSTLARVPKDVPTTPALNISLISVPKILAAREGISALSLREATVIGPNREHIGYAPDTDDSDDLFPPPPYSVTL